jgi:glycosyltransferase involved in cell wall biosynthesis
MRVAFLVHSLGLWGGVGVVVEHARRLRAEHDVDARLVLTRPERTADWGGHGGLGAVPVLNLQEARAEHWDVVVATWWETVFALHELDSERYAYFVQSMEERFYGPADPARGAAALTHDLPLAFVTEARWMVDQLTARNPRQDIAYVRNGIDKDVFGPLDAVPVRPAGAPLRILVEGSPAVALKGVPEALASAAAMHEAHTVTLVCADREAAAGARADRLVGPLSPAQMAAEYERHDVVLKLSRVEGMFAPPLEGFHRGATCVVTPVTGHDEYIEHGVNGLVTHFDDERGTARALDLLACDPALLHLLRTNALATARSWPSWQQQTQVLALALRRIAARPSPDPTGSARALAADARLAMEHAAAADRDHARLQSRMDRIERLLAKGPLPKVRRVANKVRDRRGR